MVGIFIGTNAEVVRVVELISQSLVLQLVLGIFALRMVVRVNITLHGILPLSRMRERGRGRGLMSLLDNAKTLRRNQTDAEQKLWYHLRAHRFMGRKFKRQKPLGRYVVDFVCMEEKLIIELDGGQHAEEIVYDAERTAFLQSEGYVVLRFWNHEVLSDIENVLEAIRIALSPDPSPASGRGE